MTTHDLEQLFPQLAGSRHAITSPFDEDYNCIAFAAGVSTQWWWPDEAGEAHWPAGIARDESVESFVQAFAQIGYEVCKTMGVDRGFEKVAIFTDSAGRPTHAARQLSDGMWISKLGKSEDIRHELHAIADGPLGPSIYGKVAVILRRAIAITESNRPAP